MMKQRTFIGIYHIQRYHGYRYVPTCTLRVPIGTHMYTGVQLFVKVSCGIRNRCKPHWRTITSTVKTPRCLWITFTFRWINSEGVTGISPDQLSGSNEPVWLQTAYLYPNRHPTFGLFPCLGENKNVEPQGVCELRSHFAGSIWSGWLGSPLTNYRVVTSPPFDFKRSMWIPTDTPLLVYFHVWVKIKM